VAVAAVAAHRCSGCCGCGCWSCASLLCTPAAFLALLRRSAPPFQAADGRRWVGGGACVWRPAAERAGPERRRLWRSRIWRAAAAAAAAALAPY